MKFQVVCNPLFTKETKFGDVIEAHNKSTSLILCGGLLKNGCEDNMGVWKDFCDWVHDKFKTIIIVPSNFDIVATSDSTLSKRKSRDKNIATLKKYMYKNFVFSTNPEILVSKTICILSALFFRENDNEFIQTLKYVNDEAAKENAPFLIISYNLFRLDRETHNHLKFNKWVYSVNRTGNNRLSSSSYVTNNVANTKKYSKYFTIKIDTKKKKKPQAEVTRNTFKKKVTKIFPDNDDADNEYLYRMYVLQTNRDTYDRPIFLD